MHTCIYTIHIHTYMNTYIHIHNIFIGVSQDLRTYFFKDLKKFVWMCDCLYVGSSHVCLMPAEATRGHQIP